MSIKKQDSEKLMNSALEFAEKMLLSYGEFIPFAEVMKIDGEIVAIGGDVGDEYPSSIDVIELLQNEFIKNAIDKYRVTCIVYDTKISTPNSEDKTDAIAMNIDHRDDYSVTVFFPYKIENGKIIYGELKVQPGKNIIFNK